MDVEAKAMDRLAREKRKDRFDSRKHAKTTEVVKGDKVLVKQTNIVDLIIICFIFSVCFYDIKLRYSHFLHWRRGIYAEVSKSKH